MYEYIYSEVRNLTDTYCERDPEDLCRNLGIIVLKHPLGSRAESIKGLYKRISGQKCIILNSDMPKKMQKLILAHELGHAVLHPDADDLADFGIFSNASGMEREANLFAAELLLDDEEVTEMLNNDSTIFETASRLYVPTAILDYKFAIMKWKGYKIASPFIDTDSCFLKDMLIPPEYEMY